VLGSTNFQRATPEQQQDQLSGFLTNQATMPRNVGNIPGLGTVTRAPYTVQGPTRVENHAFRSGKTDANRYEVEIGGRRIPAYLPVAPNSANGNFHTLEQVVQGLAALPASSRALVKQVDVAPRAEPRRRVRGRAVQQARLQLVHDGGGGWDHQHLPDEGAP
jgi:hypothetical protein